jgi:hypothetical protein
MNTVRDMKKVAPTCPECKCRLKEFSGRYSHYGNLHALISGRDARGCLCKFAARDLTRFDDGWYHIETTATLNWQKL